MQLNYALIGQIVTVLMMAVPSILALVLGIEEVGKRFFGYKLNPPDEEVSFAPEWGGIFEDPEEVERRQRYGLPPRTQMRCDCEERRS